MQHHKNSASDDQKNLKQVIQWPGSVIHPKLLFCAWTDHQPLQYGTSLAPARSWK